MVNIDVRVIASTNKDLLQEIKAGNFREELYYRLNVMPIKVPPLRERIEDIPQLAESFLSEYAKKTKSSIKRITKGALKVMQAHSWPGNIRELKNLLERLSITVKKNKIGKADIPILNTEIERDKEIKE
jgi:two-component system nitrogen regulation response regulator NtrX